MQHKGTPGKPDTGVARNLIRWAKQRHRIAFSLMLRGACYSTGTAAVSLITVWLQHRM